jgi:hypothetical protein
VRRFPVAKVDVDTPYYVGEVNALCMEKPVYQLILGNIPGASDASHPDRDWKPGGNGKVGTQLPTSKFTDHSTSNTDHPIAKVHTEEEQQVRKKSVNEEIKDSKNANVHKSGTNTEVGMETQSQSAVKFQTLIQLLGWIMTLIWKNMMTVYTMHRAESRRHHDQPFNFEIDQRPLVMREDNRKHKIDLGYTTAGMKRQQIMKVFNQVT